MGRAALYAAGLVLVGGASVNWWMNSRPDSRDLIFEPHSRVIEPAPLCPWRNPKSDLMAFFPQATRYRRETKVLSGERLRTQERLGRPPNAEENALLLYRAFQKDTPLGVILTRRVKGERGAIEIVLAVDADGAIRGIRLQRIREPDAVSQVLQSAAWLAGFVGTKAATVGPMAGDLPGLPPDAQRSGRAVLEGVRSLLILLDISALHSPTTAHH
jgi:hypothetical protein